MMLSGALPDQGSAIIVGENGAGKSRYLVRLARRYVAQDRQVIAISNTPFDRFIGVKGITRISAAEGRALPARLLKAAISGFDTLGSSLNAISDTLSYCGYDPGFSVSMTQGPMVRYMTREIERLNEQDIVSAYEIVEQYFASIRQKAPLLSEDEREILPYLISRVRFGGELLRGTFDFRASAFELSKNRDLANLVRNEPLLKKVRAIGKVRLTLFKGGEPVDLLNASSGELTLITTFAFLAASLSKASVILIDEPENSLHPQWQKEYYGKLADVVGLRSPRIVISTHSPIIVLGAGSGDRPPEVYQLRDGRFTRMEMSDRSGSVEKTLWEAFGTVTPKNHFVSEQIAEQLRALSERRITLANFTGMISELKRSSFDEQQKEFLDATLNLAASVAQNPGAGSEDG